MEKLKFISFIVLCLLGINRIAYSQEQDTVIIKDSIAKMKLDKKLIKLAKQVVLKHGPSITGNTGNLLSGTGEYLKHGTIFIQSL